MTEHATDEGKLYLAVVIDAFSRFEYIEGFYNRKRRHSTLGYLGPAEYERRWAITERNHNETKQSVA